MCYSPDVEWEVECTDEFESWWNSFGREKPMGKSYKLLQARMSPEAQVRAQTKAGRMMQEMALDELRRALDLTQEELARRLKVKQPAVAKIESRADMYVSTLKSVIEAMGGSLEIRAIFPHGDVRITRLTEARARATAPDAD
jgi:DNA-binding transcriptional regulator YiaG